MDRQYGDIAGYNQSELEYCFDDWLNSTSTEMGITRNELLARLRDTTTALVSTAGLDCTIRSLSFNPRRRVSLVTTGTRAALRPSEEFYDITLLEDYNEFIGRIKLKGINTPQGSAFYLENHYDNIEVVELFAEAFHRHVSQGYENIDYDFAPIKRIIDSYAPDWKAALSSVKGSTCSRT